MDLALARKLIKEMGDHAPMQIVPFFRGESLLHPHWDAIFELIKKHDIGEIQFTTNTTRLGEDEAKRLLELEIDFISFSMDTLDPDLYNRLRRGADYSTCAANVLRFLELRDKLGAKTEVQISAVETPDTKAGMDEFISYWQSKADRVRIYVKHSGDGNPGSVAESKLNLSTRMPCHKVFTELVVYWDGTVGLCNHDWTRPKTGPILGDLNVSSIEQVWHSSIYTELRSKHCQGKVDDIIPCGHCDHWKIYYTPTGFFGSTHSQKALS